MIVPAVYNIVDSEIEAALLAHPDVAESDARATIVQDHVVLRPAAVACEDEAQELQDVVKRSFAPCNYPRSVIFTGALPETLLAKARPVTAAQGSERCPTAPAMNWSLADVRPSVSTGDDFKAGHVDHAAIGDL